MEENYLINVLRVKSIKCYTFLLGILKLSTDEERPIRNRHKDQAEPLSEEEKKELESQKKYENEYAKIVRDATKEYNCHGLTFGNRECWIDYRTGDDLYSHSCDHEIRTILEDNYESVGTRAEEDAKVGDVVVYHNVLTGDITHSGIVIDVTKEGRVEKVRSKWGAGNEWEHHPDAAPYGRLFECQVCYFQSHDMQCPSCHSQKMRVVGMFWQVFRRRAKK